MRKQEVFIAALTESLADGTLSDKDRNVLAALADKLGLSALEARRLEITVVGGGAA